MSERLAKFIARSGVCSRRAAEELILQKRITVNGEIVDSPAFNVDGSEKILLDGEKLPTVETTRLWLYYKPVGLYHMAAFIHENAALPQNGWSRRYKVKVHGRVSQNKIDSLTGGVTIDGINYGPVKIVSGESQGTNSWLTITLQEGKNREIRRLMKHVGLEVARLIRLSYGPFQLGGLKKGEVREVPQKVLKEQLGEKFKL